MIELERTPCGVVIATCTRFQPCDAVECTRACAVRLDRRDRRGVDDIAPRVLVVYTRRYKATKTIADALADHLFRDGLTVEVADAEAGSVPPLEDYEAVVIGSAVRYGRHPHSVIDFIVRNGGTLTAMPAFFFCSGCAIGGLSETDRSTSWVGTDRDVPVNRAACHRWSLSIAAPMMSLPIVRDVIDGLAVFICGLDERGTILVFNRPCEQLTGLARDTAVGTSWLELFAAGERRDHVLALWTQATTGRPAGPYEALYRNGRSLRWQFSRWDRSDPAIKLWAVGIDITEEREALARAREVDRIVQLGNLVSGLAHELRNPLNSALLQLTLAERHEARGQGSMAVPIAQAAAEVRRISTLLDDFLVFVRPLPMNLERLDVRRIVERSIARAQAKALAADVIVVLEPGDEAGAEIDASRVEAGVYHLLANAIDAASVASLREARVRLVARSNAIVIEVEDRGAGVPPGDAPIFEPFFTTKAGGTGLGLAIVARVAADHDGQILHERRDGATVFRLELPIVGGACN